MVPISSHTGLLETATVSLFVCFYALSTSVQSNDNDSMNQCRLIGVATCGASRHVWEHTTSHLCPSKASLYLHTAFLSITPYNCTKQSLGLWRYESWAR